MASKVFEGKAVELIEHADSIFEICFNYKSESVNKVDSATIADLRESVTQLKKKNPKGLLLTSAKDVFIVGADITEFGQHFKKTDDELFKWLRETQNLLNEIEDLPCPSVAVINGYALGGGLEVTLTAAFRVMAEKAKIGLPETKLGLIPGWGGTVRLSRLIGVDNALEWICGGTENTADAALKVGAVDAVTSVEKLRDAALTLIKEAQSGRIDWKKRQAEKKKPLHLRSKVESKMVFEGAKGFVMGQTKGFYPAPIEAITSVEEGAMKERDQALESEAKAFVKMARTDVAQNLIGIFLADQYLKKTNKGISKGAKPPTRAAVLGAGIMGGGVAYQSASRGIPILMKDIQPKALELGMKEATTLFAKQVERKKMDVAKMGQALGTITPTLSYGDFGTVDFVVEAVVENESVKKKVFQEIEGLLSPTAVLASNTSTISIGKLAQGLKRPEKFCGLHFFNPVHKMPLVEVIRGPKTSEETVAQGVAFALGLGKVPVVVNDCPGFLVNRVLFPYLLGFTTLLEESVGFEQVDKVMEKFGWPMGPAYLIDVVGLDTTVHAAQVMKEGFPDRMKFAEDSKLHKMLKAQRLGQKNALGFYKYERDKKGGWQKGKDPQVYDILQISKPQELKPEVIIERMMIPMMTESIRCLEEKIVAGPVEVDMALINGLGFPPFRGGIFRLIDSWGPAALVQKCEALKAKGKVYEAPALLTQFAKEGKTFYGAFQKGGAQ